MAWDFAPLLSATPEGTRRYLSSMLNFSGQSFQKSPLREVPTLPPASTRSSPTLSSTSRWPALRPFLPVPGLFRQSVSTTLQRFICGRTRTRYCARVRVFCYVVCSVYAYAFNGSFCIGVCSSRRSCCCISSLDR